MTSYIPKLKQSIETTKQHIARFEKHGETLLADLAKNRLRTDLQYLSCLEDKKIWEQI